MTEEFESDMSYLRMFNEWVAEKLASILSSMAFFWLCVLLDLIELPPVIEQHSIIIWCTYLSSVVFQLLALPILGYQQKISQTHHESHVEMLDKIHGSLTSLHEKHDAQTKTPEA